MVAEHEHEQEIAVRQDAAAPVLPGIAQLSPVGVIIFWHEILP
jgi:hypothetical protein